LCLLFVVWVSLLVIRKVRNIYCVLCVIIHNHNAPQCA
jgi:hypothetical protein